MENKNASNYLCQNQDSVQDKKLIVIGDEIQPSQLLVSHRYLQTWILKNIEQINPKSEFHDLNEIQWQKYEKDDIQEIYIISFSTELSKLSSKKLFEELQQFELKTLFLNLSEQAGKIDFQEIPSMLRSLCNLQTLIIGANACQLTDDLIQGWGEAIETLGQLKSLNLSIMSNFLSEEAIIEQVKNVGKIAKNLKSLDLNLSINAISHQTAFEIAKIVGELDDLESLSLVIGGSNIYRTEGQGIQSVIDAVSMLPNLKNLSLGLDSMELFDEGTAILCDKITQLENLKYLNISLIFNGILQAGQQELGKLSKNLPTTLTTLILTLQNNEAVDLSQSLFFINLRQLENLEQLALNLQETRITNPRVIGKEISRLNHLKKLKLNLKQTGLTESQEINLASNLAKKVLDIDRVNRQFEFSYLPPEPIIFYLALNEQSILIKSNGQNNENLVQGQNLFSYYQALNFLDSQKLKILKKCPQF